jgi:A/G-specific adenine glycosylase
MIAKGVDTVPLPTVQPEHRVLFLGLKDSCSIHPAPKLRRAFIDYSKANLRVFPWREANTSPYHLLLAELLLIQTKAADVARVWPVLIERYPTPEPLACSRSRSLANLLQPLGLQNQRATALRTLAAHIIKEWDGQLPSTLLDLLSLPHVGLYAATALSCFAYGRRVPIVDANVLRVLGRIFGLPMQRELRRSRQAWAIAWALLPRRKVAQHNYALLDFAAQICTPRLPHCDACHIRAYCSYGQTGAGSKDTQGNSRL